MNRNQAVSHSKLSSEVFDIKRYAELKSMFNLPNAAPVGKAVRSPTGRLKNDRERVKEIQQNKNNYKSHKPK